MEPNSMNTQNTSNGAQFGATEGAGLAAQTGPVASTATPMAQTETTMSQMEPGVRVEPREQAEPKADGEKKKSHTMLLVVILCLVLAAGGVGFGIWAMVDSNAKIDSLNTEVASLKNKNSDLEQQITEIDEAANVAPEAKEWASTEVRDGIFYVLDSEGGIVKQSENSWPKINEIISCESDAENTIINCKINTTEGEAELMYDAFGDTLSLTIGAE